MPTKKNGEKIKVTWPVPLTESDREAAEKFFTAAGASKTATLHALIRIALKTATPEMVMAEMEPSRFGVKASP